MYLINNKINNIHVYIYNYTQQITEYELHNYVLFILVNIDEKQKKLALVSVSIT